jgi:glycosyltransferase involved in cell wall biosynthesis
MTILHVTPYFSPAWAFGGVPRAVTGLAQAQAAEGHDVIVLTTDALTRASRLPAGEAMADGVRAIRLPNFSLIARARFNLSTPMGFTREIRRLLTSHPIELIHCHELRTVENLRVAALSAETAPPLIVSPHGTLPYSIGRGAAKRAWDRAFSRRVLPRFSAVAALTRAEAADARALWTRYGVALHDDQIAVVPNGVDGELAKTLPSKAEARSRWSLGDGPVVLFLGRLTARKGLVLLVSAFAALRGAFPSARLLIAGPDEDAQATAAARDAARELGGAVVWAGFVNGDERLAALAAADVFVLPAFGEGFSIAMLEAMACGVPVLVGPECHFPEAEEAGAGLVVPLDPGAWTSSLRRVLEDEVLRRAMGVRGRDLVRSTYGWPRIAASLALVYQHALRRVRPTR